MGVLSGIKVIELAGIGPAPFCAMLLADMGADVLRVDRTVDAGLGIRLDRRYDLLLRGRRSVAIDLKAPEGIAIAKRLVREGDALIEGFRPGVAERLGLGPADCLALNPGLVYGRVTGWGQDGPLARAAGHDINYIALAGALATIGPAGGPPVPPLNLVADYGGGAAYLALGIVSALLEARSSGKGQVVDVAMVDCVASLMTSVYSQIANGRWTDERGSNLLDGGAPWYSTYRTADGKYVAIGAIEPKFYAELLRLLGLDEVSPSEQHDRATWPSLRGRFASVFATKTQAEWCAALEGTDACFAPVLTPEEARGHRHSEARHTYIEVEGVPQPAPAPRFSRTPSEVRGGPHEAGADTKDALRDWGLAESEIGAAARAKAIA
jgi:alpha-methylacyl-CoA racemase